MIIIKHLFSIMVASWLLILLGNHGYYICIYGDVIFDETYNKPFHGSLESLQYHASLAITRAIRITSKEELYLDLEFLQHRHCFSKPCTFYKIF